MPARKTPMLFALLVAVLVPWLAVPAHAEEPLDKVLGDPDAPVTIIEYASMSCPHCAAFHVDRLPWLQEHYIDTGRVNLVFRDFPLNQPALMGAMIAHCAGPERYHAFVDLLFRQQATWAFTEDPAAALLKLARLGGIGEEAFEACLADEQLRDDIVDRAFRGKESFDISSTPTFVINGETLSGVLSEERLTELLGSPES